MYGNTITMGDSIVITAFSMGLVFVALIVISYFIDLIAKVVNRSHKAAVPTLVEAVQNNETVVTEEDDEEIIAVISAAIAATSGKSLQGFVIQNIRPIENHESAWSIAGRAEAMR